MIKLALAFGEDIRASFSRLSVDNDIDLNMQIMMMAAAIASLIYQSCADWDNYDHRGDEFWKIVRDCYMHINQTSESIN